MAEGPQLRIGLSGWNYRSWRDGFYKGVPQRRWLEHCAETFGAIEVNATFYRFFKPSVFEGWHDRTRDGFVFALKGHRLVTHRHRLHDVAETVHQLRGQFDRLGDKLAAVLWQLPPGLEKNPERLAAFADLLQTWGETRHAVEFRHASWFDDETADLLSRRGIANVLSDADDWPLWDAVTADLVYVRLHGRPTYAGRYGKQGLAPWAERIAAWRADGRAVHVYFDNDAQGHAPYDALALMEMAGADRDGTVNRP
jgi:uncharacterized protein YecE (DUF72 family)